MAISTGEMQGVFDEARKTAETAARLANGDYPEDADHVRVLAGMIQKVAEQVARLADGGSSSSSGSDAALSRRNKDAEAAAEEDQTPQDAPAQPINDRAEP
jgi:hypothetical protein